ncbi:MAG: hypothetical protein WDN01_14245 [Rhizomicrobium sp.]
MELEFGVPPAAGGAVSANPLGHLAAIANEPISAQISIRTPVAPGISDPLEAVGSAGPAARERLAASSAAPPSPSELAVATTGTALTIVARSTFASEAETADLRRMLERTAAEFGMSVSEFQLNGAAVAPSVANLGGTHGHRTR